MIFLCVFYIFFCYVYSDKKIIKEKLRKKELKLLSLNTSGMSKEEILQALITKKQQHVETYNSLDQMTLLIEKVSKNLFIYYSLYTLKSDFKLSRIIFTQFTSCNISFRILFMLNIRRKEWFNNIFTTECSYRQ